MSRSAPVRRRTGASTGRSSASAPKPALLLAGAGVVVVVLVVALSNRGGGQAANAGQSPPSTGRGTAPAAAAPAPAPAKVALAGAKAGKPPQKPAPPLTAATLQELQDLLDRIKALRNEAVTARTGNADVQLARAKMGDAKVLLDQWEAKIVEPLRWQEDAQMEDWAQPAEYVTLETLYATFSRLDNEVRKGGG